MGTAVEADNGGDLKPEGSLDRFIEDLYRAKSLEEDTRTPLSRTTLIRSSPTRLQPEGSHYRNVTCRHQCPEQPRRLPA
jgi:hypothetical protein